ncbi:MAG: GUN4 domain-containing protein [Leptolyngbyaceae cyanobacterium]
MELKKPIFPLLLEGRRWLSVAAIQTADVKGGKLPPADFFDTIRKYFASATTTAQSVSVQDVVEDQIPVKLPVMEPKPQKLATLTDDLSSEKGIEYTRLRDLLKEGKWRDADQETYKVMIRAVGKEPGRWFTSDELRNFPCADLKTIDGLWTKYSNGHFGFSVQKDIWQKHGSPIVGGKKWDQFCVEVGWQSADASQYLASDELKADREQTAEFPVLGRDASVWWVVGFGFSSLASRLVDCSK